MPAEARPRVPRRPGGHAPSVLPRLRGPGAAAATAAPSVSPWGHAPPSTTLTPPSQRPPWAGNARRAERRPRCPAGPPWPATEGKHDSWRKSQRVDRSGPVDGRLGRAQRRWTRHGCHQPFPGWEGTEKQGDTLLQGAHVGNADTSPSHPLGARGSGGRTSSFSNTRALHSHGA